MDFRSKLNLEHLPLVTIGVLSYNYSRYILDALDSLLTQTYKHIELIIIDDYSKDDCPQKIENWIHENQLSCTFISHKKNLGITKTSNEIVKLAKGKYLTLFATDDIMLPERIEKQTKILEDAGEEYGMCYAVPEVIDDYGNSIFTSEKRKQIFEGDVLEFYVYRRFGFVTPTSLIRKSVYQKIDLYDERVLIEDYNFFLRLVACYKIKYCDYPCIRYRKKSKSTIFEKWTENNYERYFYDRIISNHQALSFIENKKLKTYLQERITQYLKCLAAYNSRYFSKIVVHLLLHGYFGISLKTIAIKIAKSTGVMPKSSIQTPEVRQSHQ